MALTAHIGEYVRTDSGCAAMYWLNAPWARSTGLRRQS
jgi:hypothetical protein